MVGGTLAEAASDTQGENYGTSYRILCGVKLRTGSRQSDGTVVNRV
jgi:hypothetical protein